MWKCFSPNIDYAIHYDVLHFQYDRWLYESISGTIDSAKQFGVSPAIALSSKFYSHTFWRWQHALLLNVVQQHGFPTLFITVTADEWNFPKHTFFNDHIQASHSCPGDDAFAETMAIVHTLQQLCTQYICGAATRFTKHVLSDYRHPKRSNVLAFFYRIEFQRRGTPHIHLFVWLKHLLEVDLKKFSANVPLDNLSLAYNVHHLQNSSTTLPAFLRIRNEENS